MQFDTIQCPSIDHYLLFYPEQFERLDDGLGPAIEPSYFGGIDYQETTNNLSFLKRNFESPPSPDEMIVS